jgi:GrpB-like predicted nucleotidyltransferase (UPF0157 family)
VPVCKAGYIQPTAVAAIRSKPKIDILSIDVSLVERAFTRSGYTPDAG